MRIDTTGPALKKLIDRKHWILAPVVNFNVNIGNRTKCNPHVLHQEQLLSHKNQVI